MVTSPSASSPPRSTIRPPQGRDAHPPEQRPGRRRGGRRRKIPVMSNSARSKFYRQLRAKAYAELQAVTQRLREEVAWAELSAGIHRRLAPAFAADVRHRVVASVKEFITEQIMGDDCGLVGARRSFDGVEVLFAGTPAPILRLRYSIQGRLNSLAVQKLYPFIVGNTLALARMLHEDIEIDYQFTIFYDERGRIKHVEVDRGELLALSRPLFGVATAAQALLEIQSAGDCGDPEERSTPRERSRFPIFSPRGSQVSVVHSEISHHEGDEDEIPHASWTCVPSSTDTSSGRALGFPYIQPDEACSGHWRW